MVTGRCLVCDSTDKWENVDKYRRENKGMHICNGCGFVSYPERFKTDQDAKDYYKEDYRRPPDHRAIATGQRKLHMHAHFLKDIFKEWTDKKIKPVVCDVGAAFGMYLNWVRQNFPEAELHGTEFTLSHRRVAFHEYGLKLALDFNKDLKYDLISTYKVAEHQVDADKRLREYALALKDDGYLYISVPTWFNYMENPGNDNWDLSYYYHPDHINVWSIPLFEEVLRKSGLEIIKQDHVMYGDTYLCKRNDEVMKLAPKYEDPKNIKEQLSRIKKADDYFMAQKFIEACKEWPQFPKAWYLAYEQDRAKAHKQQGTPPWEYVKGRYLDPALKSCPDHLQVLRFVAEVHMRYSRFEEAISFIKRALELRPNNGVFLLILSHCYRALSGASNDSSLRIKLLEESRNCSRYLREIDFSIMNEATNWIFSDNANIPTPMEVNHG